MLYATQTEILKSYEHGKCVFLDSLASEAKILTYLNFIAPPAWCSVHSRFPVHRPDGMKAGVPQDSIIVWAAWGEKMGNRVRCVRVSLQSPCYPWPGEGQARDPGSWGGLRGRMRSKSGT